MKPLPHLRLEQRGHRVSRTGSACSGQQPHRGTLRRMWRAGPEDLARLQSEGRQEGKAAHKK